MPEKCANPAHAQDETLIVDGDPCVHIPDLTVDYGSKDIRETWSSGHTEKYFFHSFACLATWATDRAAVHDGVILEHGEPPLEVTHHDGGGEEETDG
jgi:hypothetical protein